MKPLYPAEFDEPVHVIFVKVHPIISVFWYALIAPYPEVVVFVKVQLIIFKLPEPEDVESKNA